MNREHKKPKGKPKNDKNRPRGEPESFMQRRPVWSFSLVDEDCPWCAESGLTLNLVKALALRLKKFETMTWQDIMSHESHYIPVPDLSPDAIRRLSDIRQDDVSELFSLRIEGGPRLFGILDNGVFNILWLDPRHQVCLSAKK